MHNNTPEKWFVIYQHLWEVGNFRGDYGMLITGLLRMQAVGDLQILSLIVKIPPLIKEFDLLSIEEVPLILKDSL